MSLKLNDELACLLIEYYYVSVHRITSNKLAIETPLFFTQQYKNKLIASQVVHPGRIYVMSHTTVQKCKHMYITY